SVRHERARPRGNHRDPYTMRMTHFAPPLPACLLDEHVAPQVPCTGSSYVLRSRSRALRRSVSDLSRCFAPSSYIARLVTVEHDECARVDASMTHCTSR